MTTRRQFIVISISHRVSGDLHPPDKIVRFSPEMHNGSWHLNWAAIDVGAQGSSGLTRSLSGVTWLTIGGSELRCSSSRFDWNLWISEMKSSSGTVGALVLTSTGGSSLRCSSIRAPCTTTAFRSAFSLFKFFRHPAQSRWWLYTYVCCCNQL